jgi:hypothetical protein
MVFPILESVVTGFHSALRPIAGIHSPIAATEMAATQLTFLPFVFFQARADRRDDSSFPQSQRLFSLAI